MPNADDQEVDGFGEKPLTRPFNHIDRIEHLYNLGVEMSDTELWELKGRLEYYSCQLDGLAIEAYNEAQSMLGDVDAELDRRDNL
jgi:hypothetical protein